MPIISNAALCRLIPHHGTMCLLDAVESWNNTHRLHTTVACPDVNTPAGRTTTWGTLRKGACGIRDENAQQSASEPARYKKFRIWSDSGRREGRSIPDKVGSVAQRPFIFEGQRHGLVLDCNPRL